MSTHRYRIGGATAAGLASAACAALAGCAAVTTADGTRLGVTSTEFRAYAERVFRAQNEIATELAFAIEEGRAAAALTDAEDALLAACAPLNAVAAAQRDRRRSSAGERLAAARATPECERATSAARVALDRVE